MIPSPLPPLLRELFLLRELCALPSATSVFSFFLPFAFFVSFFSLRTLCLCVKPFQVIASEIPARPAPIPPPLPCPLASPDRPASPAQSVDPQFASLKSPRFLA